MTDATGIPATRKRCAQCGAVKPLGEFYRRKDGQRYRFTAQCKECIASRQRARRTADPERTRAQDRARWAALAPEVKRSRKQQHYLARKDAHNAAGRAWYARNRDKLAGSTTRWRAANPERAAELDRASWMARAARKKMNGPCEWFTREEIGDRDGWVCWLCQLPIDRTLGYPDRMSQSLDHVTPLALGGPHTRGNVRIAHLICNKRRGAEQRWGRLPQLCADTADAE